MNRGDLPEGIPIKFLCYVIFTVGILESKVEFVVLFQHLVAVIPLASVADMWSASTIDINIYKKEHRYFDQRQKTKEKIACNVKIPDFFSSIPWSDTLFITQEAHIIGMSLTGKANRALSLWMWHKNWHFFTITLKFPLLNQNFKN